MPLDFGQGGFLGALGQGLRGAGAVFSPQVYGAQNEEERLRMQIQAHQQRLQAEALIQGVQSGTVDPTDPRAVQALQAMGIPPGVLQASPQVQQRKDALAADQEFQRYAGGLRGSPLRDSGDLLEKMRDVPLDVLSRSPAAQHTLQLVGKLQDREEMQRHRTRDYELRRDKMEEDIRLREERAADQRVAEADRVAARREANAIRAQLGTMMYQARMAGIGARQDAAADKEAAKREKADAPVKGLIDNIDVAIRMLDANPEIAGARGMFTRGKEFVQSTFDPNTPTPASEFQSQLLQVQSAWKKLPTVAANRFKADVTKIDDTIKGLGTFTSYKQAKDSLVNLRENLSRQIGAEEPKSEPKADAMKSAVEGAGQAYEPEKYDYRVVNGVVQRKKKKEAE